MELSTRRFAAVVFDFDETIIDLEPQHTGAHAALCRELGADYLSMPEERRTASGNRIIDDIREMRAHFGWTEPEDELVARRQKHFDELCANAPLSLMAGVRETVIELRSRGFILAITSSAVGSSIEAILVRLNLRDAFTLIVDGSEVVHGKPDPEAYLLTARKLGLAPEDCLVLEDSQVGVLAAKRAGMVCIAIPNPHAQLAQDLSAADIIVARIDDVLTLVNRGR
jgi:HAD superfamily hydrolase (TIGR01509 family)